MYKLNSRPIIFLLISVFAFSSASSQNKITKKEKTPKGFEVNLPVAVTDVKKRFVANLTRKDFVILENNRQQKIENFSDEKTNPPVYVGVLMDTSPSTKEKLSFSKEAAMNFIYTLIKARKNKAAFLTFDHEVILKQDFTDKQDLLQRAVDKVKKTGQKTALYDAIWQFSDEKLRNVPGRRVIVVISDSADNSSRAKIEDAVDIAQRTETAVYIISTAETSTAKDTDKSLSKLTTETGGTAFFVNDMLGLERALKNIVDELNSQYVITYRPKNQKLDGKNRNIGVRLKVKNRKDLKVRTKTKYRTLKSN